MVKRIYITPKQYESLKLVVTDLEDVNIIRIDSPTSWIHPKEYELRKRLSEEIDKKWRRAILFGITEGLHKFELYNPYENFKITYIC